MGNCGGTPGMRFVRRASDILGSGGGQDQLCELPGLTGAGPPWGGCRLMKRDLAAGLFQGLRPYLVDEWGSPKSLGDSTAGDGGPFPEVSLRPFLKLKETRVWGEGE